jgi:hypothetical protein
VFSDEFSLRYSDLLTGSYNCVDRIVLNAFFPLGHPLPGRRRGQIPPALSSIKLISAAPGREQRLVAGVGMVKWWKRQTASVTEVVASPPIQSVPDSWYVVPRHCVCHAVVVVVVVNVAGHAAEGGPKVLRFRSRKRSHTRSAAGVSASASAAAGHR